MYIEKQWHQSIECNCTQKGEKKTTKQQPQLLTENEEDFFHFSSTVDMTTEEAGRVRRRTKTF